MKTDYLDNQKALRQASGQLRHLYKIIHDRDDQDVRYRRHDMGLLEQAILKIELVADALDVSPKEK